MRSFATAATIKPIIATFILENVGVTTKIKNNAYKYQYGAVGWQNIVSKNPPIWLFTSLENTVFNTHVTLEKVTYGTPRAIAFFEIFLR